MRTALAVQLLYAQYLRNIFLLYRYMKLNPSSVVGELMGLSRMASSFPDFDLEGKKMFLEKMGEDMLFCSVREGVSNA